MDSFRMSLSLLEKRAEKENSFLYLIFMTLNVLYAAFEFAQSIFSTS